MSSFKNIEPRRAHKERAQPDARAKFGLLEKKKDWLKRARDYHSKENRIRALKQKASFRNPDEFYFKMNNAATEGGVHKLARDSNQLSKDMIKLLKTQDIKYVQARVTSDQKKIDKLRASLHQIDSTPQNKHMIFVDDENVENYDVAAAFGTVPELMDRKHNRLTTQQLEQAEVMKALDQDPRTVRRVKRARDRAYAELDARTERATKLRQAADHFQVQKNLLSKGRRVKVRDADGDHAAVFRWKAQRKR